MTANCVDALPRPAPRIVCPPVFQISLCLFSST